MLYKNDEQYKLTAADKKLVVTKFKKFPVRLTYPEDRIKVSPSKHNKLPDKPNSISFPLRATVKTGMGSDEWRYAENRTVDGKGMVKYSPTHFALTGTFILQENDIELIWFLYTKSPYVLGGENYNGRPAKCVFEDVVGKAELNALREEEMATVKALIYSSKMGLKEADLRRVAKAYFIPNVDDMTFAQVKLALNVEINRDRQHGADRFLKMIDAEKHLETRAVLQEAIDRKLIKYTINKREWVWLNSAGRASGVIARVVVGTDPNEALTDYYMADKEFQANLQGSLKGDKVVLAEGKGDIDDDVE